MSQQSRYAGQKVALLTQPGKERIIAPVLEPGLGCSIELVTGFDTDQLGTFTREKPRPGTQLKAAGCCGSAAAHAIDMPNMRDTRFLDQRTAAGIALRIL